MRNLLWLAAFLVACTGGQTHDPGGNSGAGGSAGVSGTGGAGGTGGTVTSDAGGSGGTGGQTVPKCGNGIIDLDEQCDGKNLGGETCETLQTDSTGILLCTNCQFDTSMCVACDSGTTYGD